jgi:hypothetical protein
MFGNYINLINMKLIPIFVLCLISISGSGQQTKVKNIKGSGTEVITLHEGAWFSNFKNEVFIRCLKKIYPANFTTIVEAEDGSTSANVDWLGYDKRVLNIADSLANEFIKRPQASWKIENKKVTLNVCLNYRNSIELDNLTLLYYKKFRPQKM